MVASRGVSSGFSVQEPLDILDHHDRVVDQQADGQHQPEQGHGVDREIERVEHRERAQQHDGTAMAGTSVARQLCRNTNMTMITRIIASISVFTTSSIDSLMKSVVS